MADGPARRHVLVHVPGRSRGQQHAGVRIMSTTAESPSRIAGATSLSASLAASDAFRTFAVVVAITTPVLYVICDLVNLPAFTYHPATGRIELGLGPARSGEGPTMY